MKMLVKKVFDVVIRGKLSFGDDAGLVFQACCCVAQTNEPVVWVLRQYQCPVKLIIFLTVDILG